MSLIYNEKSCGLRTEPWGTPQVESNLSEIWRPIWVVWVSPHHILCKFSNSFLTVFRWFEISYLLSQGNDNCPNLLFVRGCLCRSNCLQLGLTCSTAADKLRFTLSDSQCLRPFNRSFPLFFLVVFTSEKGNLLTYMKNIYLSSSLERPMESSRRNTASRHRDNVHVYDKWPVWG